MTEASEARLRDGFREFVREGLTFSDDPTLGPFTLALYRHLGRGKPVERSALANELNQMDDRIDGLFAQLPESAVDYDDNGAVIAFGGLSLGPANHAFKVDGRELHTWCVFDALFLPEILRKPATSITCCPATGAAIEIELAPDAVVSCLPSQPIMSIVVPDRAACAENLRGAFCNHVNFFVDEAAFHKWAVGKPGASHVSIEHAHDLAHQRNLYRYGDLLTAALVHSVGVSQPGNAGMKYTVD